MTREQFELLIEWAHDQLTKELINRTPCKLIADNQHLCDVQNAIAAAKAHYWVPTPEDIEATTERVPYEGFVK